MSQNRSGGSKLSSYEILTKQTDCNTFWGEGEFASPDGEMASQ